MSCSKGNHPQYRKWFIGVKTDQNMTQYRKQWHMGFGSYDESEQRNHDVEDNADESRALNVHEHAHEGTVTVESGESTEELLGQLQEIKERKPE